MEAVGRGDSVYVYRVEKTVVKFIFRVTGTLGHAVGYSKLIEIQHKDSLRFHCICG